MERWTDSISQDPSGYCQGSNKYNCSRLAFNSQRYRRQCRTNQKLLSHSQHAKNSSIHQLILWITADFRVSRTKQPRPYLTTPTQKFFEISFNFPEFAPACKISVHYIYSFLRYSQFKSQVTRLATTIFGHVHPKNV